MSIYSQNIIPEGFKYGKHNLKADNLGKHDRATTVRNAHANGPNNELSQSIPGFINRQILWPDVSDGEQVRSRNVDFPGPNPHQQIESGQLPAHHLRPNPKGDIDHFSRSRSKLQNEILPGEDDTAWEDSREEGVAQNFPQNAGEGTENQVGDQRNGSEVEVGNKGGSSEIQGDLNEDIRGTQDVDQNIVLGIRTLPKAGGMKGTERNVGAEIEVSEEGQASPSEREEGAEIAEAGRMELDDQNGRRRGKLGGDADSEIPRKSSENISGPSRTSSVDPLSGTRTNGDAFEHTQAFPLGAKRAENNAALLPITDEHGGSSTADHYPEQPPKNRELSNAIRQKKQNAARQRETENLDSEMEEGRGCIKKRQAPADQDYPRAVVLVSSRSGAVRDGLATQTTSQSSNGQQSDCSPSSNILTPKEPSSPTVAGGSSKQNKIKEMRGGKEAVDGRKLASKQMKHSNRSGVPEPSSDAESTVSTGLNHREVVRREREGLVRETTKSNAEVTTPAPILRSPSSDSLIVEIQRSNEEDLALQTGMSAHDRRSRTSSPVNDYSGPNFLTHHALPESEIELGRILVERAKKRQEEMLSLRSENLQLRKNLLSISQRAVNLKNQRNEMVEKTEAMRAYNEKKAKVLNAERRRAVMLLDNLSRGVEDLKADTRRHHRETNNTVKECLKILPSLQPGLRVLERRLDDHSGRLQVIGQELKVTSEEAGEAKQEVVAKLLLEAQAHRQAVELLKDEKTKSSQHLHTAESSAAALEGLRKEFGDLQKQNEKLGQNWETAAAESLKLSQQVLAYKEALPGLEKECATLRERKEKLAQDLAATAAELVQQGQEKLKMAVEYSKAQETLSDLQRAYKTLQIEVKTAQSHTKAALEILEAEKGRTRSVESAKRQAEERCLQAETIASDLATENAKIHSLHQAIKSEALRLTEEITVAQTRFEQALKDQQQELTDNFNSECERAQSAIESLQNLLKMAQDKGTAEEAKVKEYESSFNAKELQIEQLQAQIDKQKSSLQKYLQDPTTELDEDLRIFVRGIQKRQFDMGRQANDSRAGKETKRLLGRIRELEFSLKQRDLALSRSSKNGKNPNSTRDLLQNWDGSSSPAITENNNQAQIPQTPPPTTTNRRLSSIMSASKSRGPNSSSPLSRPPTTPSPRNTQIRGGNASIIKHSMPPPSVPSSSTGAGVHRESSRTAPETYKRARFEQVNEDEEAVEEQVDAIENYDRPPPKCAIQVQKAVFIAGSTTSEDGRKRTHSTAFIEEDDYARMKPNLRKQKGHPGKYRTAAGVFVDMS